MRGRTPGPGRFTLPATIFLSLWLFLNFALVLHIVLVKGETPVHTIAKKIQSPHSPKENRGGAFVETAAPVVPAVVSRKDDSIETVSSPRGKRSGSGLSHQTYGVSTGGPRLIQDWEIEDFVLLATVDGTLHARDRSSGKRRWELFSETPVVETIYHRQNNSRTNQDMIEDDNFVWIVEPTEEGALFRYHPEFGLEVGTDVLCVVDCEAIRKDQLF